MQVVSRMLNGGEVINRHIGRNDDDTARVLTGRTFNTLAFGSQIGDIGGANILHATSASIPGKKVFKITANITICRLLSNGFNRAGTEDVARS